MVFLPNLGVNRRGCLCDVASYVSAQPLDFLDLGQKSAFLDRKHYLVPNLILTDLWIGTNQKYEHLLAAFIAEKQNSCKGDKSGVDPAGQWQPED
jgi:hypothetical protein